MARIVIRDAETRASSVNVCDIAAMARNVSDPATG